MNGKLYVLATIVVCIAILLTGFSAALLGSVVTISSRGIVQEIPRIYTYAISTSGSNYQIRNGTTGTVLYQSTNPVQVFNAVAENCNSGATSVYVASGTYTASASFTLSNMADSYWTFQSDAKLTIVNNVNRCVISLIDCTNVTLEGIYVDGNAGGQSYAGNPVWCNGVSFYNCANCLVDGAKITNVRQFGFQTGSEAVYAPSGIINSEVTNCGWNGISLGFNPNTVGDYAINNVVRDCSDVGINTWDGSSCIIKDNTISNINAGAATTAGFNGAGWGIAVENKGYYHSIVNNLISDCNYGIATTEQSQSLLITENTISNCKSGISLGSGGYNVATRNTITGDVGDGGYNNEFGIRIAELNDIVSLNTISSTSLSAGSAIFVFSGTENCFIAKNAVTISSKPRYSYGVELQNNANNNLIEGNNIYAYAGIRIENSANNNKLSDNILTSCTVPYEDLGTGTIINPTSYATYTLVFNNVCDGSAKGTYLCSNATQLAITTSGTLNVDGLIVTSPDTLTMNEDHFVYVIDAFATID